MAAERHGSLEVFAADHGGFVVALEKELGVFARSFPVARGHHRGRPVELRFGPDGYNTRRTASATHTVIVVPTIAGLPPGLRVFPSMTGGVTAKGGRRGEAATWLAFPGREVALTAWLDRHGYVSVSDALGLRVHVPGVDLDPSTTHRWLDEVDALATTLEAR